MQATIEHACVHHGFALMALALAGVSELCQKEKAGYYQTVLQALNPSVVAARVDESFVEKHGCICCRQRRVVAINEKGCLYIVCICVVVLVPNCNKLICSTTAATAAMLRLF